MTRELRELRDRRPGLPPPQFSLFSILLLTTLIAGLIVVGLRSGPVAALAGIVVLLSVIAHMASTAIGGRLRGDPHASFSNDAHPVGEDAVLPIRQPVQAHPSDFARTTQLSHKKALPRKPMLWAVAVGSGFSCIIGASILCVVMWEELSVVNVMFGAASSAVIGGMIGFWLGSLFQVARDALQEAHEES